MCLVSDEDAQPPGQSPAIRQELKALEDDMWDTDMWHGEHPFDQYGFAEFGHSFESELWGFMTYGLPSQSVVGISPDLETNTLFLRGDRFPGPRMSGPTLDEAYWSVESYGCTLPVDYYAKFFTKKFWATEFSQYGHEALRQLPYDRLNKIIVSPETYFIGATTSALGGDDHTFVRTLFTLLKQNGYPILGAYIKHSLASLMRIYYFPRKWSVELRNWSIVSCNIDEAISRLLVDFRRGRWLNRIRSGDAAVHQHEFQQFLKTQAQRPPAPGSSKIYDIDTWRTTIEQFWTRGFREGGLLMRGMSEVYRLMQDDIALMQQMIIELFSFPIAMRQLIYTGRGGVDPMPTAVAHGRMHGFRERAEDISRVASQVCQIPQIADLRGPWEQWHLRFKGIREAYDDLLRMLDLESLYPHDAMDWKASLEAIPTSTWRSYGDLLTLLAQHQYQAVDPRIREMLDRASNIFANAINDPLFLPTADLPQLNQLVADMQVENQARIDESDADRQGPEDDFGLPAALRGQSRQVQQDELWNGVIRDIDEHGGSGAGVPRGTPIAAIAPSVIPGANAGITFASSALAASAGVSFGQPSLAGTGAGPDPRAPSPAPGAAPPDRSAAFRRFTQGFSGFTSQQPVIPFGTAAPFASQATTAFPPPPGARGPVTAIPPFAHPYAGATTMTADVVAHPYIGTPWAMTMNPFSTTATYRQGGRRTSVVSSASGSSSP